MVPVMLVAVILLVAVEIAETVSATALAIKTCAPSEVIAIP
jgi:hypothetical protein